MAEPGRAKVQKARDDNVPGRTADPFDPVALAARLEEARARRVRVLESRETGQTAKQDEDASPRLQARKPSIAVISPQRFTPNNPSYQTNEALVAPPKPAAVTAKNPLKTRVLVMAVLVCGVALGFAGVLTAPSVLRQKIAILIAPELGLEPSSNLGADVALTVVPEPAPSIEPGANASGLPTDAPAMVRQTEVLAPLVPPAPAALREIAVLTVREVPPIPETEGVVTPSLPSLSNAPGPMPEVGAGLGANVPVEPWPGADDLRVAAAVDPIISMQPAVTPPLSMATLVDKPIPLLTRRPGNDAPASQQFPATTLAPPVPQAETEPLPEEVGAATDPASARIVVHYPQGSGELANAAVTAIAAGGVEQVNAQLVGFSISQTNVRYFHAEDSRLAQTVVAAITASGGTDVEARDFTDFRPQPQQGLIEVWIAGNVPQVQPARQQAAQSPPAAVAATSETRLSRAEERELLSRQVEQMLRSTLQQLQQE